VIVLCDEVLNSGSLLKAANAARLSDPGEEFRAKAKSAATDEVFYSVYSVKRRLEERGVFAAFFDGQNASPWPTKLFIFNFSTISQAGRRGFDPRLPLHVFNNLASPAKKCAQAQWSNGGNDYSNGPKIV
jgi:coproporphyrinogen III oxidase